MSTLPVVVVVASVWGVTDDDGVTDVFVDGDGTNAHVKVFV